MPEGPEIRRAADEVANAIVNKPLKRVEFGLPQLKRWEEAFINSKVTSIDTYGKAMLTRFDNGLTIYSHNQLYGRWVCCPANQVPTSTRELRLGIYTADRWALLYSASDIAVLSDDELHQHPFLKNIGRDVLSSEITVDYIINKLESAKYRNRQIGGFLTEQSFVAGLGNYLRCEILFVTRLHPSCKPSSLNRRQLSQLAQTIIDLPRQSYSSSGITNDLIATQKLIKQGSSFEDARFWVFRREGLACYRCEATIIKQRKNGQPCYICPNCQ